MPRGRKPTKRPSEGTAPTRSQSESRRATSDTDNLDDSFENLHRDDPDSARDTVEAGEIVEDSCGPSAKATTPSAAAGAPGAAAAPSWFSRYGCLLDSMISRQEEQSNKLVDLSEQLDCRDQGYIWRKEGLRMQHQVATKAVRKGQPRCSRFRR